MDELRTPRLDPRRDLRPAGPAVPRPPRTTRTPCTGRLRPQRRRRGDAAVDQDRRLPRGLRLLPAVGAVQHRSQARAADAHRRDRGIGGAQRQGRRGHPVLHGRRVALAQRPPGRPGRGGDHRRQRARHGDLRDARACSPSRRPQRLADAGLDYYNHNLDTVARVLRPIITTRTYQDRLDTLANVRDAGIKLCCGGIVGHGRDRAAIGPGSSSNSPILDPHPESVPINLLVQVPGTPLHGTARARRRSSSSARSPRPAS